MGTECIYGEYEEKECEFSGVSGEYKMMLGSDRNCEDCMGIDGCDPEYLRCSCYGLYSDPEVGECGLLAIAVRSKGSRAPRQTTGPCTTVATMTEHLVSTVTGRVTKWVATRRGTRTASAHPSVVVSTTQLTGRIRNMVSTLTAPLTTSCGARCSVRTSTTAQPSRWTTALRTTSVRSTIIPCVA